MNLKVRLNGNEKFIGHGNQKKILTQLIDGLKSGTIEVPKASTYEYPKFICFRLSELELAQLSIISDNHGISMSELLREGLRQINLIVPTKK